MNRERLNMIQILGQTISFIMEFGSNIMTLRSNAIIQLGNIVLVTS